MFGVQRKRSHFRSAITVCRLIYHTAVRSVRTSHRNAALALVMNLVQIVIMVAIFYLFFAILGLRGVSLRGDFLIFILSGVFLFLTYIKSLGAVAAADPPTSPMMQHAPMNTAISIGAAMLSTIYIQLLSLFVILFVYDVAFQPYAMQEILDPIGCLSMIFLAWLSGSSVGLILMALKPWSPNLVSILQIVVIRFNLLASGKTMVVNSMPGYLLPYFKWNPLFHIIDQSRGFAFLNYNPRYTSWQYALYVTLALIFFGLLIEFYTRKRVSMSWSAGK